MDIYVYLDESGSIHKNSNTAFFAVGGYYTFSLTKNKITSLYKRLNKQIKDKHHYELYKELKSYHYNNQEKIKIFKEIQNVDNFHGCAKIFFKKAMHKSIITSNLFFNYAVKVLFQDCIIPHLKNIANLNFIVSIDNRNIKISELNNLENYLNKELPKYHFKITYYNSATNFGIQLADLIVNTLYNSYKDIKIVEKVLPTLKYKKFNLSLFPSSKTLVNH